MFPHQLASEPSALPCLWKEAPAAELRGTDTVPAHCFHAEGQRSLENPPPTAWAVQCDTTHLTAARNAEAQHDKQVPATHLSCLAFGVDPSMLHGSSG
jgi:hypothetical protein